MRSARVFFAGRDEPEEISGADVVVVAAVDGARWADQIRDRAPNAVVLVVDGSPQHVCETTLFPRARVVGVQSDQVEAVVESIVCDHGAEFESLVRCEGERGIDGEFARVPVRIGGRGVIEIVES